MLLLVTGASGKAGRHVVSHLLAAGHRVRALTRDPDRTSSVLPASVEVVDGDLLDPSSVAPALEGVDGVHLLSSGGPDYAMLPTGPELVAAMEVAGVRRVAVLWNGEPGPVEAAVQASSLAWTRLEPADFMGNALSWAGQVGEGVVREPFADVPVAVVHEADVGAVAAAVLVDPGHERRTYRLTGPEPLPAPARVAALATALGRHIRFEELSAAATRARALAAGATPELVDFLLDWQRDPPAWARRPGPEIRRITGREPRSFAQWAEEHADAFAVGSRG